MAHLVHKPVAAQKLVDLALVARNDLLAAAADEAIVAGELVAGDAFDVAKKLRDAVGNLQTTQHAGSKAHCTHQLAHAI